MHTNHINAVRLKDSPYIGELKKSYLLGYGESITNYSQKEIIEYILKTGRFIINYYLTILKTKKNIYVIYCRKIFYWRKRFCNNYAY